MKIELHIKRSRFGFTVSYKDKKIWRSYANDIQHDAAIAVANMLIKTSPERFLKTICDCQTEIRRIKQRFYHLDK